MLKEGDKLFLPYAARESRGFHTFTEWYFQGWKPLPYSWVWHHVPQMNATWIGGVATSKTTTTEKSNIADCLAYPYFKALNTSITAKQAELPFLMLQQDLDNNDHLEHLIDNIRLRPWPIVTFTNGSTYEFRTAGEDAQYIRGFEYDRINFDECGLVTTSKISETLRHRLRGTRPNGVGDIVPRLCRLDTVTSATAAPWLKERYVKAKKDKKLYFSMKTATWDNTYLPEEQLEAMKAELTPEAIAVEMGAEWPDYGSNYFPEAHVDAMISQDMYDDAYINLNPEDGSEAKPGYRLDEDSRAGITLFELPVRLNGRYILAGDPGRSNPPFRNAGVVMVGDVSDPMVFKLVYAHWVSGNGAVRPFVNSYKYANLKYSAELRGLDTTGTQAMMDEVAFQETGLTTDKINFSSDKYGMLTIFLNDVLSHRWRVPPISGLIRQLKNYTTEDDDKIAQDLVMTIAQISWLARMVQRDTAEVETRPAIDTSRDKWIAQRRKSGLSVATRRRR